MRALLLCLCVLFVFTSCGKERKKNAYIRSYNAFIERIERSAPSFGESDWEKAEIELNEWTGIKRHEISEVLDAEDEAFIEELDGRFESAYDRFIAEQMIKGFKKTFKKAKKGLQDLVK